MSNRIKNYIREHKTQVVAVTTLVVAYATVKLVQNAAEFGAAKAIDALEDRKPTVIITDDFFEKAKYYPPLNR